MPRTPAHDHLVLAQLQSSARAMTAYELLDKLRDRGVSAPTTVYRALSRLVERGDAHRIESLNAFTACRHGHCAKPVFAVCTECGTVSEHDISESLEGAALDVAAGGFEVRRAVVELHGLCGDCRDARAGGSGS